MEETKSILRRAKLEGNWVTPGATEAVAGLTGAYVLLIRLDRPLPVDIKRLNLRSLPPGTYFYAGSAYGPGGLAARLGRHFRQDKKVHWHIDRLTMAADALAALAVEGGDECQLVERLLDSGDIRVAAEGFGSTDCRTCRSHLLAAR